MDATITLTEGMAFRAHASSGHTIELDAEPAVGGSDRGPRPLELVLMGLGGCTAMDVISILRKMRQEVTSYEVRLHADRAQEHPKVFTHVAVEHVLRGRALNRDSVRRAIELSVNRYCPAGGMLRKAVEIVDTYRIVDEVTGAETVGDLAESPVAEGA